MSRQPDAESTAIAAALVALEAATTRTTEVAGLLRGLVLNDVLLTELLELDSDGIADRNVSAPFAMVGVWNYSDTDLTIAAASPAGVAPTGGIGVLLVPAGAAVVWPLAGTTVTVYGAAGDQVLLTLWERPVSPTVAIGVGVIDGGGA